MQITHALAQGIAARDGGKLCRGAAVVMKVKLTRQGVFILLSFLRLAAAHLLNSHL
jgi:hypothetical protein